MSLPKTPSAPIQEARADVIQVQNADELRLAQMGESLAYAFYPPADV